MTTTPHTFNHNPPEKREEGRKLEREDMGNGGG